MIIYSAQWVLPISSPPIESGGLAIEDGRIIAVGTRAHLVERFPQASIRDFARAAILPGLINAHSHLELSLLRNSLEADEADFLAWLRRITVTRLERMTEDDLKLSALLGAAEAARAGVTCVGDASDVAQASLYALREVGLRGIVYKEVFGPDARTAHEQFAKMKERIAALREFETERVLIGLSPHAPYTVSAPLLEMVTDYATERSLPMMIHAAESQAETDLMLYGRGPFAEGLARRGIEWRAPGVSTIQYLAQLGVLGARPLLAHCIRTDDADIATIASFDARIAHCPKSNAKLGHGRAPFKRFLRHRVKVGLGSDSVASNNTCDILEEMRFAVLVSRYDEANGDDHQISAEQALYTATLGGARALGLDDRMGSLEAGKEADFVVIALDHLHQLPTYEVQATIVFSSSARDVQLTVVAGQEIFREGRLLTIDEDDLRRRLIEAANRLQNVN